MVKGQPYRECQMNDRFSRHGVENMRFVALVVALCAALVVAAVVGGIAYWIA